MIRYLFIYAVIFVICVSGSALAAAENTSACLMNAVTGEIVYEQDAYTKRPMASTTKIMTALVALENSDPCDIVTMSDSDVRTAGSSTYAKAGDKLYMNDSLYGLMLNSGNDAAEAIAAEVAGSSDAFAEMMNKRAKEIGANDTCFLNPSGLPCDGHYTTAYDMALITRCALQNEKFAEIVATQQRRVTLVNNPNAVLYFRNHNKLLAMFGDCTGVKTGYTKKAGRCLVSSAERNGMKYIAVTLNDPNDWENHLTMYNDIFDKSEPFYAVHKGYVVKSAGDYDFIAAEDFIIPSLKNAKTDAEAVINMPAVIDAPVNKDEKVGYIQIMFRGNEVGRTDIISAQDICGDEQLVITKSLKTHIINQCKKLLLQLS